MEERSLAAAPLFVPESDKTAGRPHQKTAEGCGKPDSTSGVRKQILNSGPQNSTTATTTTLSPSRATPSATADSNVPSLSHTLTPSCRPSTAKTTTLSSASILHAKQIQALNTLLHGQQQVTVAGASRNVSSQAPVQQTSKGRVPPGPLAVVRAGKKVVLERVETPSEEQEEINKMAKEGVHQTTSKQVFSAYTNKNPVFADAVCHPASIVEAASLADVPLPPASYSLKESIPESLITSGKLSNLQLEGVLYACQRHLTLLPSGSRAGFFIGDGAGVGKGRQIAGIILDNYARGRVKHIWFSVSHDLKMDAQRDLSDIGCYIKVIDGCQQLDKETKVLGLPAGFKEGVVFSTYATLVSTVQRGGQTRSRLQQLVDWCGGPNFQGCLVFDECHKAKNFIPGKENRSTKVAIAVTTIQKMLPKARVVYCSATGVSDVRNLAYMERLGLWGEGMAFKSFESFLDSINRRGLGAAEMLAMEMKSAGMYVSRGLSFQQAEFTTLEVVLTDKQIQIYDTAAHVWSELHKSLSIALTRVAAPNQRLWSSFWGGHQRFFKQLCMSMKVPFIVAEVKRALEDGFCVVIGLQTTGESSLENEVLRNEGELEGFVSLTREILQRFIRDHFPTTLQLQTQARPVPIQDLWCVTAKDMLLDFVAKVELPSSPLDDLIDQLGGVECVSEMTGRRGRMVRMGRDRVQYELRDTGGNALESLNNRERAAFMEGKKLIAIISDAASTGISLHSDMGSANQLRRLHITMELPWSADKAVQQLGRSHRANQSSAPLYQLVTTNLGGERRFAAAVAKRLLTLGALTKGDRRAATGVEFGEFNFNTPYGRTALRQMYNSISKRELYGGISLDAICRAAGVTEDLQLDRLFSILREGLELMGVVERGVVKEGELGDVSKFLNRILGLKVHQQNLMFANFCECLSVVIAVAKKEGRFNEGVTDIMAVSIKMVGVAREVFTEYKLSHVPTIHTHVVADRGMGWEEVSALAKQASGKNSGFYRSRREQYHRHLHLLALQKENSSHLFNIIRPNTGRSFFEETKTDLFNKYIPITAEKAEPGWKSQYESTKDHCIHGPTCKNAPSCLIGSRLSHVHLLSGGILPLLSLLETTLARNASSLELSKEAKSLRVVRVQLDDGRRLIGIRYPLPLISEVGSLLRALKQAVRQESPALPSSLPTAAKDLTVEPETPINRRTLAKALTPPVTLHNFFRTKPKNEAEEKESACGEGVEEGRDEELECAQSDGISAGQEESGGCLGDEVLNMKAVSLIQESPSKLQLSRLNHPEAKQDLKLEHKEAAAVKPPGPPFSRLSKPPTAGHPKPKSRGIQMKLLDSFAKVPPPTTTNTPIVIDSERETAAVVKREAVIGSKSRTGRKRSREAPGGAPIVKALKQMEKRAVITCPICSKEFSDITNFDLNQHLDTCLGAHQSPPPTS